MWVMGKTEPGWYCAKWIWDEKLAEHWRKLGYEVEKRNPTIHVC